jgi:hypothetical protein
MSIGRGWNASIAGRPPSEGEARGHDTLFVDADCGTAHHWDGLRISAERPQERDRVAALRPHGNAAHHRSGKLAREAFVQMAMNFTDQEFSCDYRRGFVDGFVDYLDYGGFGEPPPIPPPSYRLFGYMTPDGLAAMDEWKNGFRHGAATARASNLRDLVTLPVFWGPAYPTVPKNAHRAQEPADDKKKMPAVAAPDQPAAKPADQPMDPIRPQ